MRANNVTPAVTSAIWSLRSGRLGRARCRGISFDLSSSIGCRLCRRLRAHLRTRGCSFTSHGRLRGRIYDGSQRTTLYWTQHTLYARVVHRSIASFTHVTRRPSTWQTVCSLKSLRLVAWPAQPFTLWNICNSVALLVHTHLATLTEDDFVRILAFATRTHAAKSVLHGTRFY